MGNFVLVPFALVVLFTWQPSSAQHRVRPRENNSCEDRRTPGLICQNCELLATCVRISVGWITVPVENCDRDAGYYCNINDGGCSKGTGPCHPLGYEGNFACTSEGVYPDPYDCQKYHMCYKAGQTLVSANIECGSNKAFSAENGQCSLTIADEVCKIPQYNCSDAGDIGPWLNNYNIFYICKAIIENNTRILYPTLYRCPPGEIYHEMNCVPAESIVSTTTTPAPIIPGVTNRTSTGAFEILCKENGSLMPDPTSCRSYYYCDRNGKPVRYTCPTLTYFNPQVQSCVFGSC